MITVQKVEDGIARLERKDDSGCFFTLTTNPDKRIRPQAPVSNRLAQVIFKLFIRSIFLEILSNFSNSPRANRIKYSK